MATLQNDARLFGLDLSGLGSELQRAWRGMALWPVFAWLRPEPAVLWRRADGREQLYRGPRRPLVTLSRSGRAARFEAVEIPESLLLRHSIQLPQLPADALQGALELAVQGLSPFPAGDLLWARLDKAGSPMASAVRAQGIPVVITSRPLVKSYLSERAVPSASGGKPVEAWVDVPGCLPVELPGFGQAQRHRDRHRKQQVNLVLLMLALLLLSAIAVTPSLQLRERALDAQARYASLQAEVTPVVRQRESFVRAEGLLKGLADAAGPSSSALQIMEMITKALPDDTSLQSLQITNAENAGKLPKVLLTGQAANAAALMQQLGSQPGFRDVRAPSAAVKPLGAIKESFTIELVVDVAAANPAAPAGSAAAAAAAPANGSAPAVPAAPAAAPAAAATAAAPAASAAAARAAASAPAGAKP